MPILYLRRRPPHRSAMLDIVTANITKAEAQWIDRDTVAWLTGPSDERSYALLSAPDGGLSIVDGKVTGLYQTLCLHAAGELTEAQRARYPHLRRYRAFRVD